MRIIKEAYLVEQGELHARARTSLEHWRLTVRAAGWGSLAEVRLTFPSADAVRVGSGRTVTVFNIAGNRFRLIAALHYDRGIAYTLDFLTHAEYDKDDWKKNL